MPPSEIRPQPGPQEQFASTRADIAFMGGSAGGGKSFMLNYDPGRYVSRVPRFSAAFFRRTHPQLIGPGSLWDLSHDLYPLFGGRPRESPSMNWRFPNGSTIVYHSLQYDKSKLDHHGASYCGLYYDELTHFLGSQFWYMLSRNRSTCGVRPFIRAGTNPDPDSFVRHLVDWYIDEDGFAIEERSGVVRYFIRVDEELVWANDPETIGRRYPDQRDDVLSFTFIRSKLEDNQELMRKDPGYRGRLMAMNAVDRARLLGGNWNIRAAAGLLFQESWFNVVPLPPPRAEIVETVRWWDKAGTEASKANRDPDYTANVKICRTASGRYCILHAEHMRESPANVDKAMKRRARQDGADTTIGLWKDPGQAGLVDVTHTRRELEGYRLVTRDARQSKVSYAGPLSSHVEGGFMDIVAGEWNRQFFAEYESFPDGSHDDMVDAGSGGFLHLAGEEGTDVEPADGGSLDLDEEEMLYV